MARHRQAVGLAAACAMLAATVGSAGANAAPPTRAVELVSPVLKGGNDVNTGTVQSSPDGNRVLFSSTGGFPGAEANVIYGYYLAQRSQTAWSTAGIEPPLTNGQTFLFLTSPAASGDLTKSLQVSSRALAPGAVEDQGNIYIRDNTSGARSLVVSGPHSLFANAANPGGTPFTAATPDFSHVLFATNERLVPDAPVGAKSIYDWSGGRLTLVSRLSDETPTPAESFVTTAGARIISDDGQRIFFKGTDAGPGPLLMREGAGTTVISESQKTGDLPGGRPMRFIGANRTGDIVYFLSAEKLTDDSTANGAQSELYRYDVTTRTLTDLTVATDPADTFGGNVLDVPAMSANGDRVYFLATSRLTPDATSGGSNLYEWSTRGTRLVAALDPVIEGAGLTTATVSPDGKTFAFVSYSRPTGEDNTSTPSICPSTNFNNPAGTCSQVFVYDADTGDLECASCTPGRSPLGHSTLGGQEALISGYRGRAALDDKHVFFNTPNALASHDTNGKNDVYEWAAGAASLVTSGRGDYGATFADATPDGSSVFFRTSDQLVPVDQDGNIDLYVARAGGGLASQQATDPGDPCAGDGCQAIGPTPRVEPTPQPSELVDGAGNLPDEPKILLPKVGLSAKARAQLARKGAVTVAVRVAAAGDLSVSGTARVRGKQRVVLSGKVSASRASTVRVTLRLTRDARRLLARGRTLSIRMQVGFSSSDGVRRSTVKLKKARTRAPRAKRTHRSAAR